MRGSTSRWSKGEAAALKAERAAFLAAARLSLGKPALLLSGGGILSVYHFGLVRALLDLGMLPQLISGTSGGAVVAAAVATRTDEELRHVLREVTVRVRGSVWLRVRVRVRVRLRLRLRLRLRVRLRVSGLPCHQATSERAEQSDLYRELGSEGPLHGSYWWKICQLLRQVRVRARARVRVRLTLTLNLTLTLTLTLTCSARDGSTTRTTSFATYSGSRSGSLSRRRTSVRGGSVRAYTN